MIRGMIRIRFFIIQDFAVKALKFKKYFIRKEMTELAVTFIYAALNFNHPVLRQSAYSYLSASAGLVREAFHDW